MNIIQSGEIGIQSLIPYILSDTEQAFTTKEQAFNYLSKLAGTVYNQSNQNISDYFLYNNVPSIWRNANQAETAQFAYSGDVGLILSAGEFVLRDDQILNGNGVFNANSYARFKKSNKASLLIYLNSNNGDKAGFLTIYNCQNGILYKMESSHYDYAVMLLTYTSQAYFFHQASNHYQAPLGFLNEDSVSFNLITTLKPLVVYSIQSVIMQAHGIVKDAAERPAPNCPVRAYNRQTGQLIGQGISNTNGEYQFPIAANKNDEIYMICLDNDQAPDFEAQIQDRITV